MASSEAQQKAEDAQKAFGAPQGLFVATTSKTYHLVVYALKMLFADIKAHTCIHTCNIQCLSNVSSLSHQLDPCLCKMEGFC